MQADPKRARAAVKSGGVLPYRVARIAIASISADSESASLGGVVPDAHGADSAASTRRICSTERRVAAAMPCSDQP